MFLVCMASLGQAKRARWQLTNIIRLFCLTIIVAVAWMVFFYVSANILPEALDELDWTRFDVWVMRCIILVLGAGACALNVYRIILQLRVVYEGRLLCKPGDEE